MYLQETAGLTVSRHPRKKNKKGQSDELCAGRKRGADDLHVGGVQAFLMCKAKKKKKVGRPPGMANVRECWCVARRMTAAPQPRDVITESPRRIARGKTQVNFCLGLWLCGRVRVYPRTRT